MCKGQQAVVWLLFLIEKIKSFIGGWKSGMNEEQIKTGEWVRKITEESYRGWRAFYHTPAWKKKRKKILKRDHNSCQMCRKNGKYRRAETVHHIKFLKNVPELALTDDNLISLCKDCHEAMHHGKNKKISGYQNKERW